MTCKKHITDLSSTVGVCATCLRERLFLLMTAQAQSAKSAQAQFSAQETPHHHRKSDSQPPPLLFPRSVSPYISHRKSDTATCNHHNNSLSFSSSHQQLFYSTPQVGPNGSITNSTFPSKKKKQLIKFSLFSNLFRSNLKKSDPDQVISGQDNCTTSSSSSSPSWFSTMLSGRRKKGTSTLFSNEESTAASGNRRTRRNVDRGMSPEIYADEEGMSGYSSESSEGWKQTPIRATATTPGRRGVRNARGMGLCMSPLVRASPNNRQWKGMHTTETVVSGEFRVPSKTTSATSFCKNRSKKLVDFGRFG